MPRRGKRTPIEDRRAAIGGLRVEVVDLEGNEAAPAARVVKTAAVIDSLRRELVLKGVKPATLATYEKKWRRFSREFVELPTDRDVLLDYLAQFQRGTNRNQKNWQDQLGMLYKTAMANPDFGLAVNPLANLPSPIVRKNPIKTLSWEELAALDAAPETDQERVALDLLAGHGFRQVEVLRVTAGDVRSARDGLIWCWGKEREEHAPLLPETLVVLELLISGLADHEPVLRARRRRGDSYPALGSQGMEDLVKRLFKAAGVAGFTGHDLRRTFISLVTEVSGDELLGMRLARDRVPGVNDRYVSRDLPALLAEFSPLSLLRGISPSQEDGEMPENLWWRRGRVELPVQTVPQ